METKRPDESDDFAKKYNSSDSNASKSEYELDDLIQQKKHVQSTGSLSRLRKVYLSLMGVFCGYQDSGTELDVSKQHQIECQRRVENFQSLNQTKFEKCILTVNLVIILIVAVVLYVFFSIPPEYHIFSHIKLNQTIF